MLLEPRDRCHLGPAADLILGMTVSWQGDGFPFNIDPPKFTEIDIEATYSWDTKVMSITRLASGEYDLVRLELLPTASAATRVNLEMEKRELGSSESEILAHALGVQSAVQRNHRWLHALLQGVVRWAFCLVPADRGPREEKLESNGSGIPDLLSRGHIKEAFFRAHNHPDALIRHRYKQLQSLLTGPPFERPPFVVTHDPDSGRLEIVEERAENPYRVFEVPLDLAGLGIAQIYSIVAQILLPGMRAVGIEEPEAHLHAPTSGLHLRQLLERMVEERYIDQLFIATHSNLFDLDDSGYYDVSFDPERGTMVARRTDLIEIDEKHLYEPGPAKHALLGFLRYMDEDAVVFRKEDGAPVSVKEMLDMLQRDDLLALEFLRDVTGAAVRAVRVKSKKADAK
jgi:hypothetical protein